MCLASVYLFLGVLRRYAPMLVAEVEVEGTMKVNNACSIRPQSCSVDAPAVSILLPLLADQQWAHNYQRDCAGGVISRLPQDCALHLRRQHARRQRRRQPAGRDDLPCAPGDGGEYSAASANGGSCRRLLLHSCSSSAATPSPRLPHALRSRCVHS